VALPVSVNGLEPEGLSARDVIPASASPAVAGVSARFTVELSPLYEDAALSAAERSSIFPRRFRGSLLSELGARRGKYRRHVDRMPGPIVDATVRLLKYWPSTRSAGRG